MNSSTIRRLAADHASLHNAELPPHYIHLPSSSGFALPDDLSQFTILLTGPQGTPYSQGLWKIHFKIPNDYPKSPPKVSFRTRIWHPNVEENTGSVCVDTLKQDWQPNLTLRDILIIISCLLIQPNPDSALNATAGHLLQDDYESFARQAKLMTSIHAAMPDQLREPSLAARRRGEGSAVAITGESERRPISKCKSMKSSGMVMKKLPHRLLNTQSAPLAYETDQESGSLSEDDQTAESKENDPMLSPTPVSAQAPRRPTLPKRPLSDLPVPSGLDPDPAHTVLLSASEQNIANGPATTSSNTIAECLRKGVQPAERSTSEDGDEYCLQDLAFNGVPAPFSNENEDENGVRPLKRICTEGGKENATGASRFVSLPERSLLLVRGTTRIGHSAPRKASAPGLSIAGRAKAMSRVGVRRL